MAEPLVPRIRVPHPHVRVDPAVLAGSPHVNGSRVPVRRLWAWHRGGASVETLVKRYPNLGPARILDALAFAYDNQDIIDADLEREQQLLDQQGGKAVGTRPLAQLALPFDGGPAPKPPVKTVGDGASALAAAEAPAAVAASHGSKKGPAATRRR